jgi:hypothetical protein
MAEYKCEPTRWHEMLKPVQGGRETYQVKSWNPPFEKDPWTKEVAAATTSAPRSDVSET